MMITVILWQMGKLSTSTAQELAGAHTHTHTHLSHLIGALAVNIVVSALLIISRRPC
jgi:hypothetical protein